MDADKVTKILAEYEALITSSEMPEENKTILLERINVCKQEPTEEKVLELVELFDEVGEMLDEEADYEELAAEVLDDTASMTEELGKEHQKRMAAVADEVDAAEMDLGKDEQEEQPTAPAATAPPAQ